MHPVALVYSARCDSVCYFSPSRDVRTDPGASLPRPWPTGIRIVIHRLGSLRVVTADSLNFDPLHPDSRVGATQFCKRHLGVCVGHNSRVCNSSLAIRLYWVRDLAVSLRIAGRIHGALVQREERLVAFDYLRHLVWFSHQRKIKWYLPDSGDCLCHFLLLPLRGIKTL